MQVFINALLKDEVFISEQECDIDQIQFRDGKFIIEDRTFEVIILGDHRNIPLRFEKDFGDGYPRLICDYDGVEHDWMLDDILLVEV